MGRMMDGMTIGQIAESCDVSRDTVRFYERERLLPTPKRTASGYRLYQPEDAARIRFVRRAQAMGFTIRDIRELLELRTVKTQEQCRRVAERIEARMSDVDRRIKELEAFRVELRRSLAQCRRAMNRDGECPVVLDLGKSKEGR